MHSIQLQMSSLIDIQTTSHTSPFSKTSKNRIHVPTFVEIYKHDPDSLSQFQKDTATALMNNNANPKQDPNRNYNILHNRV